jgi:hypothetical protein
MMMKIIITNIIKIDFTTPVGVERGMNLEA